jgi:C-terminal processing protease CtpA/Prc
VKKLFTPKVMTGAAVITLLAVTVMASWTERIPGEGNDVVLEEVIQLLTKRSWVVGELPRDVWVERVNTIRATVNDVGVDVAVSRLVDSLGDGHSYRDPKTTCVQRKVFRGDVTADAQHDIKSLLSTGTESNVTVTAKVGDWLFVRVPNFDTVNVVTAIHDVMKPGTGIVLDLRGVPGGSITVMTQVAGLFHRGFLWWVTSRTNFGYAVGNPFGTAPHDAGLIIIVDSGTQSAAEAFAGALQWRNAALIVGETTAGNTDVIQPHCLRDGSTLWVAEGVIFPLAFPTHPGWLNVGVQPDVHVPGNEAFNFLQVALRDVRSDETPSPTALRGK